MKELITTMPLDLRFPDVKKPKRKGDWKGRYVRLDRHAQTRAGIHFPAGEIMKVTRNYGGLHLESVTSCPHCSRHRNHLIKGTPERDVTLLPEDFDYAAYIRGEDG